MTPTQREQLNRFLAEKVMGWAEGEYEHDGVYRSEAGIECFVAHWNPLFLLQDCTLLLDKIERDGWDIWAEFDQQSKLWTWQIVRVNDTHDDGPCVENSTSRTEALCLAIARAYGWKEEI